jgi:hypothetical protein
MVNAKPSNKNKCRWLVIILSVTVLALIGMSASVEQTLAIIDARLKTFDPTTLDGSYGLDFYSQLG